MNDRRIEGAIDALNAAAPKLKANGQAVLERMADWVKLEKLGTSETRGGGLADAEPIDRVRERQEDRTASRYHAEFVQLLDRITADAQRVVRLLEIGTPAPPRRIEGKDMLKGQVAAAGLCVSCFRYDKTNKDREKDANGDFYDKEACRRCAGFRHEHGIYPPLMLLEAWHARGKNWTSKLVTEALAQQPARKAS